MTSLRTPLEPGDVVHAWIRPLGGSGTATLTVEIDGTAHALAVDGPTQGFLPVAWTSTAAGEAHLTWSPDAAEVSLIYAFTPATVADRGIRVLWTVAASRLDPSRYRLHFHPPFGWMNDPNGLCEVGGVTHLFYQHNPHGRRWDTMHWGHALSHDRLTWVHQPIALLPEEALLRTSTRQGGAFSGTVRPEPDGALRFFFTDRDDRRLPTREWQMTARSGDGVLAGPPVVLLDAHPPVPGFRNDWRDPFVFAGPDGRLKMLLGGADEESSVVLLYETDEPDGAGGWRFVDVMFREPSRRNIPAECPCMIALEGEGAGLWVLIFGLIGSRDMATGRRNLTRTHVGRFDGRTFEALHEHELDFGTDCYAMQVWRGADGPCGIAWAANWTDVFADRDFESAMTLPRRLLWRDGRLATPPAATLDALRGPVADLADEDAPVPLPAGLAEIALTLHPGTPFTLLLDHPDHEMALSYDGTELEFRFEPPGNRIVPRYRAPCPALGAVRVFIDVGLIEIYADEGRACCTKRFDSPLPVRAVRLARGQGGHIAGHVWTLRPVGAATRAGC